MAPRTTRSNAKREQEPQQVIASSTQVMRKTRFWYRNALYCTEVGLANPEVNLHCSGCLRYLDVPAEKRKDRSEYKSTPFLCRGPFKDDFIVSKPRDADWRDKVMTFFSRQHNSDNDVETEPPEPEPTPAVPETPAPKKQKQSIQYKDWTISSEGQTVVVKKVPFSHVVITG